MAKHESDVLTPRQMAQRRGISLSYVYHELWANRIPGARKVGKVWRIPGAAIRQRKSPTDLGEGRKGKSLAKCNTLGNQ